MVYEDFVLSVGGWAAVSLRWTISVEVFVIPTCRHLGILERNLELGDSCAARQAFGSNLLGPLKSKDKYTDTPKGPCAQIVYSLAPTYLYRDYFQANLCTIWVHGPLNPKPHCRTLIGTLKGSLNGSLRGYVDPHKYRC